MMNSMTGFGKAEMTIKFVRCTAEVTSFNNRFLELSIKLPRQLSSLEGQLRELVGDNFSRGKVSVYISYDETGADAAKYHINMEAFKSYYGQLAKIQKKFKIPGQVQISDLLALPEIFGSMSESIDEKKIWPIVEKTAIKALDQMSAMRAKEGAALAGDMVKRLVIIKKHLEMVKSDSRSVVDKMREKLKARIEEVLGSTNIDQTRLEQEVVFYADKSDITEEYTRFASHIEQFENAFKLKEPVGKKFNFLLQEMNREANTIAAKSSELNIAKATLVIKEEIEKLREQVQNVE
ncbi:MAG: YicC/YloC family endoribonuclease [Candidatus Zixiibacteriota bacterium]